MSQVKSSYYSRGEEDSPRIPYRLVATHQHLITTCCDHLPVDPAFLATLIGMVTEGEVFYRYFLQFNYTYYVAASQPLYRAMKRLRLEPEEFCANYGLFAVPYVFAYSRGFEGRPEELYQPEMAIYILYEYVKRTVERHNGNLKMALGNYGFLGNYPEYRFKKLSMNIKSIIQERWNHYERWKEYYTFYDLWQPFQFCAPG